jgi:hypothetical protein
LVGSVDEVRQPFLLGIIISFFNHLHPTTCLQHFSEFGFHLIYKDLPLMKFSVIFFLNFIINPKDSVVQYFSTVKSIPFAAPAVLHFPKSIAVFLAVPAVLHP